MENMTKDVVIRILSVIFVGGISIIIFWWGGKLAQ